MARYSRWRYLTHYSIQRSYFYVQIDFNFAPDDAAYSLLTGMPLTPLQSERILKSRVIHISVDPSVPLTGKKPDDDEEGAETDPDRIITNARSSNDTDGLLDPDELAALYQSAQATIKSAYDEGQRAIEKSGQTAIRCGKRLKIPDFQKGSYEPEFTNYTTYWKLVLGNSDLLNLN
jgi:RNA exonuclease NGL2